MHSTNDRKRTVQWLFWFMILNGVMAMGVGCLYLNAAKLPTDLMARIFLFAAFPSHFITLSFLAFPLLLIIGLLWPNRRVVTALAILSGIALLLFLLIDGGVYSLYRFHLNGMVWNLVTSGVAGEVLSLTWVTWATFFALAVAIVCVELFLARFLWRKLDRLRFGVPILLLVLVLVAGSHLMHAWADFVQHVPVTRTVRMLPGYKPVTMKRLMRSFGVIPAKRVAQLQVEEGSGLVYPLETLKFSAPARPYNLLMIVIDSWRYDMLGPDTTPNIWKLASESWIFDHYYSASNCTRFGIFSMFYGIYGTYWHAFLAEQRGPLLISELKKRGYEMGIFASAPLSNPEFHRTVFVDVMDKVQIRQEGKRGIDRDQQITRKMVQFLGERSRKNPYFGFLFYDATHSKQFPDSFALHKPYIDQVNYLTLDKNKDPKPYINSYKNSLAFVDSNVGEVLAALRSKGELENTIVVITGDHGEEFNDLKLGYWGHNGNFSQYQTRTPFVIRYPGQSSRHFSHLATSLDVAPTLMRDLFGCSTDPSRYSNGTYLTDSRHRPFVHVSTWDAFALIDRKRICIVENKGTTDIVDCSYNELPGERMDVELSKTVMEGMSRFHLSR